MSSSPRPSRCEDELVELEASGNEARIFFRLPVTVLTTTTRSTSGCTSRGRGDLVGRRAAVSLATTAYHTNSWSLGGVAVVLIGQNVRVLENMRLYMQYISASDFSKYVVHCLVLRTLAVNFFV